MIVKRYIEYDLREAEYISGISRGTLLNHMKRGWLDAYKSTSGKWTIEHNELMDYMFAQFDRGAVLMYDSPARSERMECVILIQDEQKRRKEDK